MTISPVYRVNDVSTNKCLIEKYGKNFNRYEIFQKKKTIFNFTDFSQKTLIDDH